LFTVLIGRGVPLEREWWIGVAFSEEYIDLNLKLNFLRMYIQMGPCHEKWVF
jgi:hypothetical protein